MLFIQSFLWATAPPKKYMIYDRYDDQNAGTVMKPPNGGVNIWRRPAKIPIIMPMMKKPRRDGHLIFGLHRSPQANAYMMLNTINWLRNHVGPQLYVPAGKSKFGKNSDLKPVCQ